MSQQGNCNSNENNQVYGFLCPKTNVFYAFESLETYQQFLEWLSTQEPTVEQSEAMTDERLELPMVDEAQQLADYEIATREIMKVFEHPAFGAPELEIELQEIDFWDLPDDSQWYLFVLLP